MIQLYSTRELTYETDELPAIADFAHKHHNISKDEYLAGIWFSDLHRQLLWSRLPAQLEGSDCSLGKPKHYRAPSFSWAFIEGPIIAYYDKYEKRVPWDEGRDFDYDPSYNRKAKMIKADTTLRSGNILDEVTAGFLTLQDFQAS